MQVQQANETHVAHLSAMLREYWTELNPKLPLLHDEAVFEIEVGGLLDFSKAERGAKILLREDQPVGFALYILVENNRSMMIQEFYVRPEARRQGIGRTVVEKLISEAENMGVGLVGLNVAAFNTGALAFWKALGFEISQYGMVRRKGPSEG